jgi:ABC-type nitrate/sulfonate/bicarbonate transport system permease component
VLWNVHLPLMTGYLKQAYISAVGMGLKMVVSTEYLVQTKNSLGKAINTSIYFNEYEVVTDEHL